MARGHDAVLVNRVRGGDRAAFDQIQTDYTRRVRRYVQRRVSTSDAEDVTQEIFLNVFRSIASFRGESTLEAWIYGVARRTVAGRFKRRPLPITLLGNLAVLEDEGSLRHHDHPESILERNRKLERMQRTCARFSDDQWRMFEMRYLEGRAVREIALALARSEDAVKSLLYRLRRTLLQA
jgi:RNA polymerase sigma-70 factor (ECF subfamily)